jgi:hypothetical protein
VPGRRSDHWDASLYIPVFALPYWENLGPFVRRVVDECAGRVDRTPEALYAAVTPLALWAWQVHGEALTIERVFRGRLVEDFIHRGMTQHLPHSRATIRSTLWRILELLAPGEAEYARRPISRSRPTAPYSEAEVADLYGWALGQQTEHRRMDALALLALGCGAGLATRELLTVSGVNCLLDPTGAVTVRVSGTRERDVPVLPQWRRTLTRVVDTRPEVLLFRPNRDGAGEGQVTDFLLRHRSRVDVKPAKMRATWLVTHLTLGTSPAQLLRISGLSTLASLDRLRPFVPSSGVS